MNCPACDVPLTHKSGETDREEYDPGGGYSRFIVSYWHSFECPVCRRSTGPRGAKEWAQNDVKRWKEEAA